MADIDKFTKISPDMDTEAQRWVEAANIPRLDLGPAFANITIRRGTPTRCRSKQHAAIFTPKMLKHARSSLGTHSQKDLPTVGNANAFDESFADALTARLVSKRASSRSQLATLYGHADAKAGHEYDGERTPLLATTETEPSDEETRPRSDSLQPVSKIKPSLSICLWNEVCHTSQYTRPVTEILREVLEVRYPAPDKPAG